MKNILRMKNFNILGFDWKTWGGGVTKNQYIGGNCLKGGGLDSFLI